MKQLFTDYIVKDIRSAAILTNSYVAGTVLEDCQGLQQANLLVSFTKGSLTSGEVKVEFSADGTSYFQETFSAITSWTSAETLGIHQMTASGNYIINLPINYRYIKVSVQGTGTVTGSSMSVKAILAR